MTCLVSCERMGFVCYGAVDEVAVLIERRLETGLPIMLMGVMGEFVLKPVGGWLVTERRD